MKILENEKLSQYTTFRTGGSVDFLIKVKNVDDVLSALEFIKKNKLEFKILGGGSNILATDNHFNGTVIKIENKGIKFYGRKVICEAGEDWDNFVKKTVDNKLSGLENLSAIPGTVGGAVYGNIGAYGVEIKDTLEWVEALDLKSLLKNKKDIKRFSNSECKFSYRNSFFKTKKGKNFLIIRACFKLKSPTNKNLNLWYKDLRDRFSNKNEKKLNLKNIRKAIIEIRKDKLPDIKEYATAGSFFKNPILKKSEYQELLKKYPNLPSYQTENKNKVKINKNKVKVPLAWIIDKICNLKGYKNGSIETYKNQALVIVSKLKSEAMPSKKDLTTQNISDFADHIAKIVKEKTNIEIEREVEFF